MTQTISGNLSEEARLLILNEADMVIEHNATTSGSYEISGLSDGPKVILSRTSSGETFGYASVSGIIEDTITGDDFSTGIDNWTTEVSAAAASVDWYQNDSLRISVSNGTGPTDDDWGRATWNYTLSGDWDVEVGYKLLSGSGEPYNMTLRLIIPGSGAIADQVVIMWVNQFAGIRAYWYDGSVHEDGYYATRPNGYDENLRLRITKVGGTFTTYHDSGTGSWALVKQFSIPAWANSFFKPRLQVQRSGYTGISAKFDNLVINSGTIQGLTSPYTETFTDNITNWLQSKSTTSDGYIAHDTSSGERLLVYSGNVGSGENYAIANWYYYLEGDFDIQVDYTGGGAVYQLTRFAIQGAGEGNTFTDGIYIDYRTGGDNGYYTNVYVNGSSQGTNQTGGHIRPGKFRIVRSGNDFTAYSWTGSAWTEQRSATITTLDGDRVQVRCESYRWGSGAWVSSYFDNFTVNSGTIVDRYLT